jgi:SM-20-related protein
MLGDVPDPARSLRDEPAGAPSDPGPDPALCDGIAQVLAQVGWCVTDGFLPQTLVATLRSEVTELHRTGGFHPAGIGRGSGHQVRPEVRGDEVFWLEPAAASVGQRALLERLEALRQAINRALFLGLFEFEGHLAVYPPGAYYRRHLDQFRGVEARTVTCVSYLNDAWCAADGGQLRLYPDPADPESGIDILPLGGRLVTFLSADLPHEVLAAGRERLSVTGWFKHRSPLG